MDPGAVIVQVALGRPQVKRFLIAPAPGQAAPPHPGTFTPRNAPERVTHRAYAPPQHGVTGALYGCLVPGIGGGTSRSNKKQKAFFRCNRAEFGRTWKNDGDEQT